ncbi:hypothetical protein [Corynebacterium nuruki]|uniref:hypothetical protein n=1 Tax=Corynebacterium nuruki TaxID=1032851 RepID=UPI0002485DC0|nr:hypothetical protein [Corynebacterium nuruki]
MTHPGTSLREQLWSPVQNSTLWLGWWLHGLLSTDDLIDAFQDVQGPAHVLRTDPAADDPFDGRLGQAGSRPTGLVDLFHAVREVTRDAPVGLAERPLVGLALAGAGDPPPLPAGSNGAVAVTETGAGITVADADPDVTHVAVPRVLDRSLVEWTWYRCEGRGVPAPVLGPGDADRMLRDATDRAAGLVAASGTPPMRHTAPRLAVGALSDAFGLPGLPPGVATRAAKLMARADVVASIIEVTRSSNAGAGLDPLLLPLSRAVRTARTTAVDHAMRELLR